MASELTLVFPDDATRDRFIGWFSDGGGESTYFDAEYDSVNDDYMNVADYVRGEKPQIILRHVE